MIDILIQYQSIYFIYFNRNKRKNTDPKTPDPHLRFSKRRWDGLVRKWRRQLHEYDPPNEENNNKDDDDEMPKIERLTTKDNMEEISGDNFDDSDLKDLL